MVDGNSAEYYSAREQRERHLASVAISPGIAAIHRELAERYARLVMQCDDHRPRMILR